MNVCSTHSEESGHRQFLYSDPPLSPSTCFFIQFSYQIRTCFVSLSFKHLMREDLTFLVTIQYRTFFLDMVLGLSSLRVRFLREDGCLWDKSWFFLQSSVVRISVLRNERVTWFPWIHDQVLHIVLQIEVARHKRPLGGASLGLLQTLSTENIIVLLKV